LDFVKKKRFRAQISVQDFAMEALDEQLAQAQILLVKYGATTTPVKKRALAAQMAALIGELLKLLAPITSNIFDASVKGEGRLTTLANLEAAKVDMRNSMLLARSIQRIQNLPPGSSDGSNAIEDLRGKKPNAEWLAAFTPWEGTATDEDWAGPLVDLFSPDYLTAERKPWDTPALYPNSRRFIDLRDGKLEVSEDIGDGKPIGKRFDPASTASPVLMAIDGEPNKKKMNFFCRIPEDAPPYEDAKAGALTFTVEIGKAFDRKVRDLDRVIRVNHSSVRGIRVNALTRTWDCACERHVRVNFVYA